MVQEKGWKKVRNAFNIVRIAILRGRLCGKMKRKAYLCSGIFIYAKKDMGRPSTAATKTWAYDLDKQNI